MGYFSHYSKWHNHNDPNYVKYIKRKFKRSFSDYLPASKDAAVLEIGCANGMALATLRDLGYSNLLGIEVDVELAQIALGLSLQVIVQDAGEFIRETKEKFDFIYLFDVLEHFKENQIPAFLKELHSLLNDNGKLMLIVPNATSPAGSFFRYIDWTHHISFTPTSIAYLLEEAKFMDIIITDESLIERPIEAEYNNPESFNKAQQQSERARFYESFARWEMTSMFGSNPYNLLVAPNMKIVACKRKLEKVDLKIIIEHEEIFDLHDVSKTLLNNSRELTENNNKIYAIENSLNTIITEIEDVQAQITESDELKEKLIKNIQLLTDGNSQLEKKENEKKLFIEHETQRLEYMTLNLFKQNLLKKRKKLWRKILYKIKAHKLKKLIENSGYFDVGYYLENNTELKESSSDPIFHYILYGAYEGLNPSKNFNTDEYIKSYPEILVDEINPLVHMILHEKEVKKNLL